MIFPEDFNYHCDLDRNQKLPQNTLAVDDAPLYHVWLQKVQKFRRYGTKSCSEDFSPHCDHDREVSPKNPNFLHDTLGHDEYTDIPSFIQKG